MDILRLLKTQKNPYILERVYHTGIKHEQMLISDHYRAEWISHNGQENSCQLNHHK